MAWVFLQKDSNGLFFSLKVRLRRFKKEGGNWHGTVALDAENIRRFASGPRSIHFRLRRLRHNYLKDAAYLLIALTTGFGENLSYCLWIYKIATGPEQH